MNVPVQQVERVLRCVYECAFCNAQAQVAIPMPPQATAWEQKNLRCVRCKGYPPMALVGMKEEMPKRVQPASVIPHFGKPS